VVAAPALRHRVIIGLEGQREGVSPDSLVEEVLGSVQEEPA
jgi:MoxR-like ATPase